ncbi:peroxisome assembly protein (Peroxin-2) [Paramarasmius palmivorus]|uniref:RING-type E3 ubiquitin transferase (cysteine targeting) n=1 Tax=Paramarasmius palmivorus TaxID=297713 RepID=A0AAW0EBF6_9AGAR
MSPPASWDNVWNSVQPSLSTIKDYLRGLYAPNPRVLRVGQLDSELLDQELVHLLQEPLTKTFAQVNAVFARRFDPELALLIQLTLYRFSMWNTGASYGAKLQGLRYISPSRPNEKLAPSGLPRRILVIHGTLTILLPYLYARIWNHALSHAWPDAPSSDRRRKAWVFLGSLESIYSSLGLASFVAFLWNGHYRTIADRLLNMRLVPSRRIMQRDVSYEFMNRQMVWHAFTEFLLFLLPLINSRKMQRRLGRITSSLTSIVGLSRPQRSSERVKRGKYWSLPDNQCAICAESASFNLDPNNPSNAFTSFTESMLPSSTQDSDTEAPAHPIYNPYITSCGHIYCYHCIAERMLRVADEGDTDAWECLRCAEPVSGANRYEVEAVGSEASGSEYEFSDFDVTDMSGSVGSYSYSESGLSDE